MSYGVAYNDKNNIGFSDIEPWIESDLLTFDSAFNYACTLSLAGYCNIKVFIYDDLPESVTYTFVDEAQVFSL